MTEPTPKGHITHNIGIIPMLLIGIALLFVVSCNKPSTPRPDGYFRIESYPDSYTAHTIGCIKLHINDSARCQYPPHTANDGVVWLNLIYPRYNATIYLSYIPIDNNLDRLIAESTELVYRQNINTEMVEAVAYENPESSVYATLYVLSSESATPIQFIATDSVQYLLRGALYYDKPVKADSVAPSLQYLENDIMQLIESITPINK